MIAEFTLLIFSVTAASDNERIAATSLLQSASWNDALINFSRGQWSLCVSESGGPLNRHGLLAHITCLRDGTIETRTYEANIPLNATIASLIDRSI